MDKRSYTTRETNRKDGSGSIIRIPADWVEFGKRYDVDHDGDEVLIHFGTRRKCRAARFYGEFICDWDPGTRYEAWREGDAVRCKKA